MTCSQGQREDVEKVRRRLRELEQENALLKLRLSSRRR